MKLSLLSSTAALLIGLTTSLSGFAQAASSAGTATGTNTDSVSAGTGNAGDKTQQPGASSATKSHTKRKHHRAHHAASPASGA